MEAIQDLGRTLYIDWSALDIEIDLWAKHYFGAYASAKITCDQYNAEKLYIDIYRLKDSDVNKFTQLYRWYGEDKEDAELSATDAFCYTKSDGAVRVSSDIVVGIIGRWFRRKCGHLVSTYNGVYMMVNAPE